MPDISLSNNSIQAMGLDAQIRPFEVDAPFLQSEMTKVEGVRSEASSPEQDSAPLNPAESIDTTTDANTQRINSMFLETGIGSITERLA